MQTFLPYSNFQYSASVLDYRRLGKQRVEARQILRALLDPSLKGWKCHPATKMWRGYEDALAAYGNVMILEWERRGYKNNMPLAYVPAAYEKPWWLGKPYFHVSHQSNLYRKDPVCYDRFKHVGPDIPYYWPIV